MKKLLVSILLLGLFSTAQADEPIQIGWQDLQGKAAPYEDPFRNLTEDQLYHLSIYARILAMQKSAPGEVTDAMNKEGKRAKEKLIAEKIDIDYMLEQRSIIIEKRQQAAMATNSLLADKNIEIAGHMLVLELDNELVTEFLLQPRIGAGSHKPVPPANQLVLIKTPKGIKEASAYMPIKVTGILRITPQAKDLYLADGKKNIDVSYSLDNAAVEFYSATH